jgi:hypothetical protein
MASRLSASLKTVRGRVLLFTSTTLGAAALSVTTDGLYRRKNTVGLTPAEVQFNTSSMHPKPEGWTGSVWSIRNDYPMAPSSSSTVITKKYGNGGKVFLPLPGADLSSPAGGPRHDAPWLDVDFRVNPLLYCAVVKEYCWEGNVSHGFVVQKNTVHLLRYLTATILTMIRFPIIVVSQLVSRAMDACFRLREGTPQRAYV